MENKGNERQNITFLYTSIVCVIALLAQMFICYVCMCTHVLISV